MSIFDRSFKTALLSTAIIISGGIASAATIQVAATGVTVNCTSCSGFVGGSLQTGTTNQTKNKIVSGTAAGRSSTSADLYSLPNQGDATEAQALDILLDGLDDDDFVGADGMKTEVSSGASVSFTSLAKYILFKFGNGSDKEKNFFVELTGTMPSLISYNKNNAQGGGLSHYTEYGERDISVVPLPAGILLMLGALGGLAGVARGRKKTA